MRRRVDQASRATSRHCLHTSHKAKTHRHLFNEHKTQERKRIAATLHTLFDPAQIAQSEVRKYGHEQVIVQVLNAHGALLLLWVVKK